MFKAICLAVGLLFIADAYAASTVAPIKVVTQDEVVPAASLYRPRPKYPDNEVLIQSQKEAWMAVDFIIDKKGKVKEPVVVISNGDQAFIDEGLKTLKKWQYKPANIAGQPIEQGNNVEVLAFRLTGKQLAASRKFIEQFDSVWALIDSQQYVPAYQRLLDLELEPRLNLYEDAWYWFLQAHYYLSRDEDLLAITYLKNALVNGSVYLPKDKYSRAVTNLYMALVRQNQFVAALKVAQLFENLDPKDQGVVKLTQHAETLRQAKPNLVDFSSAYIVNNRGVAGHQLTASAFTMDVKEGSIKAFELRCDKRIKSFQYDPKGLWKIPASWGKCNVVIEGRPGTILILSEKF